MLDRSLAPLARALYQVDPGNLTRSVANPHHRFPRSLAAATASTAPSPALELPTGFFESEQDPDTTAFLTQAKLRRSPMKDVLGSVLQGLGYSLTDANAVVDRGRMFLLGKTSLERLFGGVAPSGRLLLDVGAGDGNVTSTIAPGFERVVCVEASVPMGRRLRARGFVASTDIDVVFDHTRIGRGCYDLVTLLNVLDRADRPQSLLKGLTQLVKPKTGRLLLGVVLPFCPFVEGGKQQRAPAEPLPMTGGMCREGATFERSLALLVRNVLEPLGWEVERWTRLPYLSEGDSKADLYILDDAVLVLRMARSAGRDVDDAAFVKEPDLERLEREGERGLLSRLIEG